VFFRGAVEVGVGDDDHQYPRGRPQGPRWCNNGDTNVAHVVNVMFEFKIGLFIAVGCVLEMRCFTEATKYLSNITCKSGAQ
jgi:hypothetical protein